MPLPILGVGLTGDETVGRSCDYLILILVNLINHNRNGYKKDLGVSDLGVNPQALLGEVSFPKALAPKTFKIATRSLTR